MGSKSNSSTTPFTGQQTPAVRPAPNAFEQFYQNMPQEYFGNAPINDPSAILNAYMKNMPQFLTIRPEPVQKAVATSSGGGKSAVSKILAPHEKLAKTFVKPFKKLF